MSDALTLDPPGSIAVVGAGPLGIEAALYGRYMGYDVTLFEAETVASRLCDHAAEALPMSPDRCLSPLAVGALHAQFPGLAKEEKPTTIGDWIKNALQPLADTDLLRGRLKCPARVFEISQIEIQANGDSDEPIEVAGPEGESEPGDGDAADIPPDFRLSFGAIDSTETIDVEAVILAVGDTHDIATDFDMPVSYLFRIGESRTGQAEQDFWTGLKEIVAIYAELAGRADLDLYRPRRH